MLNLSDRQVTKIKNDFASSLAKDVDFKGTLKTENITPEEELCLEFIYAYMPVSDLATYRDPAFLLKQVRSTLSLFGKLPWVDKLPGDIFFNYVLAFRINNEDLVNYRQQFFDEIYPRIKDLSIKDAILEVNYWCFEKATYRSTDPRTSSPLNTIRCAYGRCGEESVLTTAALRSVGIPSRQCYTPRWAHCDDNHAWVEVYDGEKWHFIGACEPEPVMDSGWFTASAQRGMLIYARVFSGFMFDEEISVQTPVITQLNILNNYAKTKYLTISVVKDNKPLPGAEVRFELINEAELFPVLTTTTSDTGKTSTTTGWGSILLHVSYDGRFTNVVAPPETTEITVDMSEAVDYQQDGQQNLFMQAPPALPVNEIPVSEEQKTLHNEKSQAAVKIRESYQSKFYSAESAAKRAEELGYPSDIANVLETSRGNYPQIEQFLSRKNGDTEQRTDLLLSLRPKDWSDTTADTLESHLSHAVRYKDLYDREIFKKYILCPRVYLEMIGDYRQFIDSFFTVDQKTGFINDPPSLLRYLDETIEDATAYDYNTIFADMEGLLKLKKGSVMSKKILFVAILRTLGVPARLNPSNYSLEYYDKNLGVFLSPEKSTKTERFNCKLTVNTVIPTFTVAKLVNARYQTLNLRDKSDNNYELESGHYRLIAAKRMLDGSINARLYFFTLNENEQKVINVEDIADIAQADKKIKLPNMASITCPAVAYIDVGKEPTEHLLNELLDQEDYFRSVSDKVLILLRNDQALQNQTLKKVIDKIGIPTQVLGDDRFDDEVKTIKAALEMEQVKMPLVLAIDGDTCVFSIDGYNVGTGVMISNHIEKLSQK